MTPDPFDGDGMPDWGNPMDDPEFAKVLWDSLPESVRLRFQDHDEIESYLRKVDTQLRKLGLRLQQVGMGIDPVNSTAILHLQTEFSEEEEQFQSDKQLAAMLWDENESRVDRELRELREAAERGDKGALGL